MISELNDITRRLSNRAYRFSNGSTPMQLAWFPGHDVPLAFGQVIAHPELPADHGYAFAGVPQDIGTSLSEELAAITEWLENGDPTPEGNEPEQSHKAKLHRIALAYSTWNRYAVPLRVAGERVYRLRCPQDHLGMFQTTARPAVDSISIDAYVALAAAKTASDAAEIHRLHETLQRWKGVVALLVIGLIIAAVFAV